MATSKPCKERLRILIGQLKDSRRAVPVFAGSVVLAAHGIDAAPAHVGGVQTTIGLPGMHVKQLFPKSASP